MPSPQGHRDFNESGEGTDFFDTDDAIQQHFG